MSLVKRKRELKKAEKAAHKRAKRHGIQEVEFAEPKPTVRLTNDNESPDSQEESEETEAEQT